MIDSSRKTSKVIEQAKSDKSAMDAYIKHRLKKAQISPTTLRKICARFNSHKVPVPQSVKITGKKGTDRSFDVCRLFEYCYKEEFMNLNGIILSAPLKWLGTKITGDDAPELVILRERVRLQLLKNGSIPHFSTELNKYIPNPLNEYKKKWSLENIERFAGIHTLDQSVINKAIKNYRCQPRGSGEFQKSQRVIYRLARNCNSRAKKALIARQYATNRVPKSIASRLNEAGIKIFSKKQYVSLDQDNITEFVETNFKKKEQNEMFGYRSYTNNELLKLLKDKPLEKTTTLINHELCKRLRDSSDNILLKSYIEIKGKRIGRASILVQQLKKTKVKYVGKNGKMENCTEDNLARLFKNKKTSSAHKIFKKIQSPEDVLKKIETRNSNTDKAEILRRSKTAPELVEPYIIASWRNSRSNSYRFCHNSVDVLNQHNIPAPSAEKWEYQHIEEFIRGVAKK